MNRKTLEELAAGHALGALAPDEARELASWLSHDVGVQREVAAFTDTVAAFAAAVCPPVTPREGLKSKILAAVAGVRQERQETAPLVDLPEGFQVLAHDSEGWEESGVLGFRTKTLSSGPQPGYRLMLICFDPGVSYGEHIHEGIEEVYMISGHLETEGRLLGPGDFMRGEVGTHHRECYSPDGCVALLICRPALVE